MLYNAVHDKISIFVKHMFLEYDYYFHVIII